ncbi:MAG TPA: AAA family ATPase [Chloroflexia bacterium]|nr:AAA family ATPase [Chloroflexia bacterium]
MDEHAAQMTQDYLVRAKPAWLEDIRKKSTEQGRCVFLLHFNIQDLVFDPAHKPASPNDLKTVTEYLTVKLRHRDSVLYYSLHTGIEVYRSQPIQAGDPIPRSSPESLWMSTAGRALNDPQPLAFADPDSDDPARPHSWRSPNRVFRLLDRALTNPYMVNAESGPRPMSLALIIDYLHHLTPMREVSTTHEASEVVETLQSWSTDPALPNHKHLVILLTTELAAVHAELQGTDSRIESIYLPRPDRKLRAEFLGWLAHFPGYEALRHGDRVTELANLTSGMNFTELRDFAHTMQSTQDWRVALSARRAEAIRRASRGMLIPRESDYGLNDVAGYTYAKQITNLILTKLKEEGGAGITGMLFTGPPGTGKSYFARALARDAGIPVVEMGDVRGPYVGETERNLSLVLDVARSMAPVIIFVDEVDQAFSNRQGRSATDSGVEQRVLQRLLRFMDDPDNTGRVFWVAASNRPDLLDAALLSRFRLVVPFLMPDGPAIGDLVSTKLPRQAKFSWAEGSWTQEVMNELRKLVGKYSGRELDTIVRSAQWYAQMDGQDTRYVSGQKYLLKALREASVGHDPDEYLRWSLLALQRIQTNSRELADAVRATIRPDYAGRIISNPNGYEIDKDAVSQILRELRPADPWAR